MSDYVVAIYCFIDDFLIKIEHKEDKQRKMSDALVLTTALVATHDFYGNMNKALHYMKAHHKVQVLDKSGFNRRLHKLEHILFGIFRHLANTLKKLNVNSIYSIDSFPVSVCRNIRIPRCRILQGEEYRGFNASKREYFFGFKVQVITTEDGLPVDFFFSKGSYADVTAFQAMQIDLPPGSSLYADSAYTDYLEEDLYAECGQVYLQVCRKSNSKRQDPAWAAFLKEHYRKRIETSFSEITAMLPRSIHAVTERGFLLKIALFLFAYTLGRICEEI